MEFLGGVGFGLILVAVWWRIVTTPTNEMTLYLDALDRLAAEEAAKETIGNLDGIPKLGRAASPQVVEDAIKALVDLGYTKAEAKQKVDFVLKRNPDLDEVVDIIKESFIA